MSCQSSSGHVLGSVLGRVLGRVLGVWSVQLLEELPGAGGLPVHQLGQGRGRLLLLAHVHGEQRGVGHDSAAVSSLSGGWVGTGPGDPSSAPLVTASTSDQRRRHAIGQPPGPPPPPANQKPASQSP